MPETASVDHIISVSLFCNGVAKHLRADVLVYIYFKLDKNRRFCKIHSKHRSRHFFASGIRIKYGFLQTRLFRYFLALEVFKYIIEYFHQNFLKCLIPAPSTVDLLQKR